MPVDFILMTSSHCLQSWLWWLLVSTREKLKSELRVTEQLSLKIVPYLLFGLLCEHLYEVWERSLKNTITIGTGCSVFSLHWQRMAWELEQLVCSGWGLRRQCFIGNSISRVWPVTFRRTVCFCAIALTVSFLLLWRDAATKTTYQWEHLTEGLRTVSEGEPVTITAGSTAAGRQGSGAMLRAYRKTEQAKWEWCGPFKPQSPGTHLLQRGHAS